MNIKPNKIRKARKEAGLSQEACARRIGISTASWQSYELGRRNMPQAKWDLFVSMAELARIVDGRK